MNKNLRKFMTKFVKTVPDCKVMLLIIIAIMLGLFIYLIFLFKSIK